MRLRNLAVAAAMASMPLAASAVTFDSANNVAPGTDNQLSGAPYFFDASFEDDDDAGSYDFTFSNVTLGTAAVTISQGTVLQNTLDFLGGVTVSWVGAGMSEFVPEGAGPEGFSLTSILQPGEFGHLPHSLWRSYRDNSGRPRRHRLQHQGRAGSGYSAACFHPDAVRRAWRHGFPRTPSPGLVDASHDCRARARRQGADNGGNASVRSLFFC